MSPPPDRNVPASQPSDLTLPPRPAPPEMSLTNAGPTFSGSPSPAGDVPPELVGHPRYRVLNLLGRGGMGAVYLAEHLKMGRKVALKVIHATLLGSHPKALARFQQEVKAAARLNHPNIVQAFDADQAGQLHFLVMQVIEGADL